MAILGRYGLELLACKPSMSMFIIIDRFKVSSNFLHSTLQAVNVIFDGKYNHSITMMLLTALA